MTTIDERTLDQEEKRQFSEGTAFRYSGVITSAGAINAALFGIREQAYPLARQHQDSRLNTYTFFGLAVAGALVASYLFTIAKQCTHNAANYKAWARKDAQKHTNS